MYHAKRCNNHKSIPLIEEKASVTISKRTRRDLTCKSDDASDIFYSRPSIVAVSSAKKNHGESLLRKYC